MIMVKPFDASILSKLDNNSLMTAETLSSANLDEQVINALKRTALFGIVNVGKYFYMTDAPKTAPEPRGWIVNFPIREAGRQIKLNWNQFQMGSLMMSEQGNPEVIQGMTWYELFENFNIVASRFWVESFQAKDASGHPMMPPFTFDPKKLKDNKIFNATEVKLVTSNYSAVRLDAGKTSARSTLISTLRNDHELEDYIKKNYLTDAGKLNKEGEKWQQGFLMIVPYLDEQQVEALDKAKVAA